SPRGTARPPVVLRVHYRVLVLVDVDAASDRVTLRGIRPVAPGIHLPEIDRRLSLDDPLREILPRPARLGDAEAQAAGEPEAVEAKRWAEERVAVGRVGDRAIDDALDARPCERRHACHRAFDDRPEPLGVRRQEVGAKRWWNSSDAERLRAPLVRTEQEALRLLPEVVRDVDLPEERQL